MTHVNSPLVHLALDLKHKRPVALKVLHPELATALGPERFQREIELAARLQHPHDQLAYLLSVPSWISVPALRVDHSWDPLRGNPRFERLLKGS